MSVWKKTVLLIAALSVAAGCSRPVLISSSQPSKTKDQYLRVKKVSVFPFENYSDLKDADKAIDALLVPALRDLEVFDAVEDTRFTRDIMKKLKITSTDILDKELMKKFGDEMNVQAIVFGKIVSFGKGKEKDSSSQVTMDLSLFDPSTGSVLWAGNVSAYGGLTAGKVFGVTEGMLDIEVARDAVKRITRAMASDIRDARNRERKGVIAEIRKEEEQERARLEKLKGETGKIQATIDKAKAEAQGIRDSAAKDAEKSKTDLELQKAAFEAEKTRTQAAQQEIDQEKLKVEVERKKVAEELKRIEDEKRALEEARRKAEEAKKAAESPAASPPPATPPAPADSSGTPPAPAVPETAPAPPAGKTGP